MFLTNQFILLLSLYSVTSCFAFESRQKILEDVQDNAHNILSQRQKVFSSTGSDGEYVKVVWLNEKSTPGPKVEEDASHKSSNTSTILNFDDIPTTSGLSNISTYGNMSFSSFKLVNVPLAINASILDPEDNATASSLPNALLGSTNFSSHATIPRIYVANDCSSPLSNCTNDFPHPFHPVSMRIKPIDFIPDRIFIDVTGWELDGKEVLNMYSVWMVFGFSRKGGGHFGWNFKLSIDHWGEGVGEIHVLEIKCRDPEGKDWRFSVDDLELSNSVVED